MNRFGSNPTAANRKDRYAGESVPARAQLFCDTNYGGRSELDEVNVTAGHNGVVLVTGKMRAARPTHPTLVTRDWYPDH
jgi:hypothetical protein